MSTKIQWTQETWNPVGGCAKKSPGCKNCYAIRQVHRMAGNPNQKIAVRNCGLTTIMGGHPNWTGATSIDEDVLLQPLKRRRPTTYFISLSDLFYDARPDEDIDRVFAVMALAHWHTFQILTKYAERMEKYLNDTDARDRIASEMWFLIEELVDPNNRRSDDIRATARDVQEDAWPLPNVWLGVSAEDQARFDNRIAVLMRVPAEIRFVSLEPILSEIALRGDPHWVIVGGESGPGARPCDVDWIRSIVRQCQSAGVACFCKQAGSYPVLDGKRLQLKDRKGGDLAELPADIRIREFPNA